jgi:hypothetical protein
MWGAGTEGVPVFETPGKGAGAPAQKTRFEAALLRDFELQIASDALNHPFVSRI